MEIAKYVVPIRFDIPNKEMRKVDGALKKLEARLDKFSKNLGKTLKFEVSSFLVDQKKLNLVLGNALDVASAKTSFELNKFVVDQSQLNRTMRNAMAMATKSLVVDAKVRPQVHPQERVVNGRTGGIAPRHAVAAGGIGGLAARMYAPALAIAGGGYGLAALNRRNQEVVSAQLQTQAVVQQAGGTAQQGTATFDFLRQQANRVGFNYLEAAPDFNNLLSGLTGAGMSIEQGQNVYTGFAELARTNKLDRTRQNRLFRALAQVAGKDKLMSEELRGQIAEALPGGVALFADAYQNMLKARGQGGDLTGAESIQALEAAMKKGNVRSEILTFAAQLASQRAQPTLGAASRASQAEQARFQNITSDLAILASQRGVEEGFARIFRTLTDGLKESGGLVTSLSQGFNDLTKVFAQAFLSVQSIQRFFQGRDSFIGDKFFPTEEDRAKAFEFLGSFKNALQELDKLNDNIYNGWLRLFGLFENNTIIERLTKIMNTVGNAAGAINDLASGNYKGAIEKAKAGAFGYAEAITAPGVAGANALLRGGTYALASIDPRIKDPSSVQAPQIDFSKLRPYDPAQFEANVIARQRQEIADRKAQNFSGALIYPMTKDSQSANGPMITPNVDVKMEINVASASPEDFNDAFQAKVKDIWETTLLQFSQKE